MSLVPRPRIRAGAIVFAVGLLAGAVLAWVVEARRPPRVQLARTGEAPRATRLDALGLRDTLGVRVDLARVGVPQVVMISSTSCGVCRSALADFRSVQAAGGSFARLTVVTIEGADSGAVELRAAHVQPGAILGPADDGARTTMAFQFPGTPIFISLDSAARVVASLPGYPGREAFTSWVDVMAGRRVAP